MPESIGNPEVISSYSEILMKSKDAVAQPPKHLRADYGGLVCIGDRKL
jgi:hypothetical protein